MQFCQDTSWRREFLSSSWSKRFNTKLLFCCYCWQRRSSKWTGWHTNDTLHGQKVSATPLNLYIRVFLVPLIQAYKVKHIALQPASTNMCETGCSKELSQIRTVTGCYCYNKSVFDVFSCRYCRWHCWQSGSVYKPQQFKHEVKSYKAGSPSAEATSA